MNAERDEQVKTDPEPRTQVEALLSGSAGSDPTSVVSETPDEAMSEGIEIAHVLFIDLVGYSLLPMDKQKDYLADLKQVVRDSRRFRTAEARGDIISLPTGDGMALVFTGDPIAAVQCSLEVTAGLRGYPHIKLRMGLNSGPVYRISDVNAGTNVAGTGINIAQRVMDCGDAGHILLSKSLADMLIQVSVWTPRLTDLGETAVKHGVKVHIFNLVTAEAGNREIPAKLRAIPKARFGSPRLRIVAAAVLLLILGASWWFVSYRRSTVAPDEASIAVLPFVDMSAEKNQAYFADGLAEELLGGLAGVPGLRVAARSSSFRFREGNSDFRAIRESLQVANILQGSVRKQANRARITVQLINTADGFQLWANSFDKDMTDILAVEQDIAKAVTERLRVRMLAHGRVPEAPKTTNGPAYDAYLRGLYLDRQGTRESFETAANWYEQALQLDPGSARTWAALGSNRADRAQHNYIPRDEGYRSAREALNRAIAFDPNLASPHSTLAWIAMYYDWNWSGALSNSQKALALEPGNPVVLNTAATVAMLTGRRDEAIALYGRAIRIDPLSSAKLMNQGNVLYYAGRYAEAEAALKKAIGLAPDRDDVHLYLGLVRIAQGKGRAALGEAEKEKSSAHRLFALALANQSLGNKAAADANLAGMIAKFGAESPCLIGEAYAHEGDKDRAFEWLERAYKARDPDLTEIKGNPLLRSVELDPRYGALLREIGLS